MPPSNPANMMDIDMLDEKHDEDEDTKSEISINLSTKLLSTMNSTNDKNNNKSHIPSLNNVHKNNDSNAEKDGGIIEPNNNNSTNTNRNLMGSNFSVNSEPSLSSSRNSANSHPNNNNEEDYEDNMVRAYERNLKNLNQKFLHEMNEHHNIDQYLLSWRGFHGNMCKGFHTLQRDGQMVDVTIAAGGKIFKAHKLVNNSQPVMKSWKLHGIFIVSHRFFQCAVLTFKRFSLNIHRHILSSSWPMSTVITWQVYLTSCTVDR